jgi:hypothetical protein
MIPCQRALLAVVAASAPFLTAATAGAQTTEIMSTRWRQQSRTDAIADSNSSSQLFAFELRFAPYYPQVDSEFKGKANPYTDVFGTGAQFYFGLEADFLPLRIPYVGLFGGGLGWGYTSTSTSAKLTAGPNKGDPSGEDTSLSIMPMYAAVVLRADELMRRTGVPIVPYGKFGVGFALWNSTKGSDVAVYSAPGATKSYRGAGNATGLQFALGAALSLNFIDPRSAARLDESTGVNHIYLFGEWMNSMLNNFGSSPAMRVGTSTVVAGLALDI